jgi:acyl-CoA thioesterase-2
MLAGNVKKPAVYTVDRIRDGKSFATRRVVAVQEGRALFSMAASFHRNEPGYEHQDTMPEIEGPDGIESEVEMAKRLADRIPREIFEKLICKKPIEIRVVNPINPFAPKTLPPEKYIWFRAAGQVQDDMSIHRCMMAYTSDFHLVGTALYPHGKTFWSRDMQVASLDHSIWFHRNFHMDGWFLYAMKSPSASLGRGLSLGSIFTQDGTLVASVAQEGLLRPLKK